MESDISCDERSMQIQQIHDVELVASNILENLNGEEIKASNWVNSHILK